VNRASPGVVGGRALSVLRPAAPAREPGPMAGSGGRPARVAGRVGVRLEPRRSLRRRPAFHNELRGMRPRLCPGGVVHRSRLHEGSNRNADVEAALGLYNPRPGPDYAPGVDDACDENPCPRTRPASVAVGDSPTSPARSVTANGRFAGYGVASPAAGSGTTGFHYCPCGDASADTIPVRDDCSVPPPRGAGCVLDASAYRDPFSAWQSMTLDVLVGTRVSSDEVEVGYSPPASMTGDRDDELVVDWNFRLDTGVSSVRTVVWSFGVGSTRLASFPRFGLFEHFDLTAAPDGSFALVASRARPARHAVVLLAAGPGGLTVRGFARGRGSVVGPARASSLGISMPVQQPGAEAWEPFGYRHSELLPARRRHLRGCF